MNKLDLKTRLFLYETKANNLGTPNYDDSIIEVSEENPHDVYVFDSYEDYFNYFKLYLKNIDISLINKAIYTIGKKGHVVALKDLCERIIIKQRVKEFYEMFNQEKIDEIHARGNITPMEKVEEFEEAGLCAPGDGTGSASCRCNFFNNCHECLVEYASHAQEYDRLDFELINSDFEVPVLIKKI